MVIHLYDVTSHGVRVRRTGAREVGEVAEAGEEAYASEDHEIWRESPEHCYRFILDNSDECTAAGDRWERLGRQDKSEYGWWVICVVRSTRYRIVSEVTKLAVFGKRSEIKAIYAIHRLAWPNSDGRQQDGKGKATPSGARK